MITRIRLVALSSLALMAVAVSLAFVPFLGAGTSYVDLKVVIAAPAGGNAQLYYDRNGAGYSEAESTRVLLTASAKPIAYYLPLPSGTYHTLRLDPVDNDHACTIHEACVLAGEGDGEVVATLDLTRVTPLANIRQTARDEGALQLVPVPGTNDPCLLLPLSEPLTVPVKPRAWLLPTASRGILLVMIAMAAAGWYVVTLVLARVRSASRAGFPWLVMGLRAALLGFVLVPVFVPKVGSSEPRFEFRVEIAAAQGGHAEVFYDLDGRGFSADSSSRDDLGATPNLLSHRFALPPGRYRALRFDPIDAAVPVDFRNPEIVAGDGSIVRSFAFADFTPAHDIERFERRGNVFHVEPAPGGVDPFLLIRLPSPFELKSPAHMDVLGTPVRVALPILAGLLVVGPWLVRLGRGLRRKPA